MNQDSIIKTLLAFSRVIDFFPQSWIITYEKLNVFYGVMMQRVTKLIISKLIERGILDEDSLAIKIINASTTRGNEAARKMVAGLETGRSYHDMMKEVVIWARTVSTEDALEMMGEDPRKHSHTVRGFRTVEPGDDL